MNMTLKSFIIGVLIIGGAMLAITNFQSKLASDQYYANARVQDSTYDFQAFNKIENISRDFNETRQGFEEIIGKDTEAGTDFPTYQTGIWQKVSNVVLGTKKIAGGTTKGIYGALTLGFSIVEDIGMSLNNIIPGWVITLTIVILTVSILMLLTKFITGKET